MTSKKSILQSIASYRELICEHEIKIQYEVSKSRPFAGEISRLKKEIVNFSKLIKKKEKQLKRR